MKTPFSGRSRALHFRSSAPRRRAPIQSCSRVVADRAGVEHSLAEPPQKDQEILIQAAALQVPGYDEAICFAVDRPQKGCFDGARICISAHPGEPLWFGLARPDRLDPWRQSRIKK